MRNKRNSRQKTVLRSLFKTLHPILESGLAPARRLLTGTQESPQPDSARPNRVERSNTPTPAPKITPEAKPLERTLTDENLVVELENITRQFSQHGHTANTTTTQNSRRASPHRGQPHYSRDRLLTLLEEAKVRIQVLETELEIARGMDETIPMLTEEWSDEVQFPSSPAKPLKQGKSERRD